MSRNILEKSTTRSQMLYVKYEIQWINLIEIVKFKIFYCSCIEGMGESDTTTVYVV